VTNKQRYSILKHCYYLLLAILIFNSKKVFGGGYFTENKGQWDKEIVFKAELNGLNVFICKNNIRYQYVDGKIFDSIHKFKTASTIKSHHLFYTYVNCNKNHKILGYDTLSDYSNYMIGEAEKWQSNVLHYKKIILKDIYEGIDIIYSIVGGKLKYDIKLKEGKKLNQVSILIEGAEKINISENELIIKTSLGLITEYIPKTLDYNGDLVSTKYTLEKNIVSFEYSANISRRQREREMLVDPILIFSTYSGSVADNFGYTATYDKFGNGYAGGSVFSLGFPVTAGAFNELYNGGIIDVGISKYNSKGTARLYATYIGGSLEEHVHSMIVNNAGELVIFGSTNSLDFPIHNKNSFQVINGGNFDIFVMKIMPDGRGFSASTYIGGSGADGLNGNESTNNPQGNLLNNYADNFRGEVIIDEGDNIYITSSTNSPNFPVLNGAQLQKRGTQDACVFKLSADLSNLKWSTYIGCNGNTCGNGIVMGKGNYVYITGGCDGNGLTALTNAYSQNFNGGKTDGFITRLNKSDGNGGSTYIGTNGKDQSYLIQTDKTGRVYIFGQTTGNFPIGGNTFNNLNSGQFIMRLDSNLSNFDKSLVFGSGTKPANISPSAFLVDACDRVFISGWGGGANQTANGGNTLNMPITSDALQRNTDGSDFYLAVFSKDLEELLFGSYFGGTTSSNEEHVDGGTSRFDPKGIIYQSVCASCNTNGGFPTTIDAWSRTNLGKRPTPNQNAPGCNNAIFKIDLENFNRKPKLRDTIFEIYALDNLNFIINAIDNDKHDSLYISAIGFYDTLSIIKKPIINITNGLAQAAFGFNWTPDCSFISKDTLLIYLKAKDNGCPSIDSIVSVIKIVVKAPDIALGPTNFCLIFDELLKPTITWEAFNKTKFYKETRLVRANNLGQKTLLKTFTSSEKGTFSDLEKIDFINNNYCYFFITENICGNFDTSLLKTCTKDEFFTPITATQIVLVTVEKDSFIKIICQKSNEADFRGYRLFKRVMGKEKFENYDYHKNISDTIFYDYKVNVDQSSYCYYMVVEDNCGHKSKNSDTSCSILLKGVANPFSFSLSSNAYTYWAQGVREYDIYSIVDTGNIVKKHIADKSGTIISGFDDKLDYDWGGYYYQYRANNYINESTPERISLSNTIYLVQPPLLHVPTAFSPNGDGRNDEWGIVDVFVKTYQILVFSRWGEKVFDSEDKNAEWSSVYKNDNTADNVYIWIAYYTGWDNNNYQQKGNVTIVR